MVIGGACLKETRERFIQNKWICVVVFLVGILSGWMFGEQLLTYDFFKLVIGTAIGAGFGAWVGTLRTEEVSLAIMKEQMRQQKIHDEYREMGRVAEILVSIKLSFDALYGYFKILKETPMDDFLDDILTELVELREENPSLKASVKKMIFWKTDNPTLVIVFNRKLEYYITLVDREMASWNNQEKPNKEKIQSLLDKMFTEFFDRAFKVQYSAVLGEKEQPIETPERLSESLGVAMEFLKKESE